MTVNHLSGVPALLEIFKKGELEVSERKEEKPHIPKLL